MSDLTSCAVDSAITVCPELGFSPRAVSELVDLCATQRLTRDDHGDCFTIDHGARLVTVHFDLTFGESNLVSLRVVISNVYLSEEPDGPHFRSSATANAVHWFLAVRAADRHRVQREHNYVDSQTLKVLLPQRLSSLVAFVGQLQAAFTADPPLLQPPNAAPGIDGRNPTTQGRDDHLPRVRPMSQTDVTAAELQPPIDRVRRNSGEGGSPHYEAETIPAVRPPVTPSDFIPPHLLQGTQHHRDPNQPPPANAEYDVNVPRRNDQQHGRHDPGTRRQSGQPLPNAPPALYDRTPAPYGSSGNAMPDARVVNRALPMGPDDEAFFADFPQTINGLEVSRSFIAACTAVIGGGAATESSVSTAQISASAVAARCVLPCTVRGVRCNVPLRIVFVDTAAPTSSSSFDRSSEFGRASAFMRPLGPVGAVRPFVFVNPPDGFRVNNDGPTPIVDESGLVLWDRIVCDRVDRSNSSATATVANRQNPNQSDRGAQAAEQPQGWGSWIASTVVNTFIASTSTPPTSSEKSDDPCENVLRSLRAAFARSFPMMRGQRLPPTVMPAPSARPEHQPPHQQPRHDEARRQSATSHPAVPAPLYGPSGSTAPQASRPSVAPTTTMSATNVPPPLYSARADAPVLANARSSGRPSQNDLLPDVANEAIHAASAPMQPGDDDVEPATPELPMSAPAARTDTQELTSTHSIEQQRGLGSSDSLPPLQPQGTGAYSAGVSVAPLQPQTATPTAMDTDEAIRAFIDGDTSALPTVGPVAQSQNTGTLSTSASFLAPPPAPAAAPALVSEDHRAEDELTRSAQDAAQDPAQQPRQGIDEDGTTCVVCMDAPREFICVPCGHYVMCGSCQEEIMARGKECPTCRAALTACMKVFK